MQKIAILQIALISTYVLARPVNASYYTIPAELLENLQSELPVKPVEFKSGNSTKAKGASKKSASTMYTIPAELLENLQSELPVKPVEFKSGNSTKAKGASTSLGSAYANQDELLGLFQPEPYATAVQPERPVKPVEFKSGSIKKITVSRNARLQVGSRTVKPTEEDLEAVCRNFQPPSVSPVNVRGSKPLTTNEVINFINNNFPAKYGPNAPQLSDLISLTLITDGGLWKLESIFARYPNFTNNICSTKIKSVIQYSTEQDSTKYPKYSFQMYTTPHSLGQNSSPMILTFVKEQ